MDGGSALQCVVRFPANWVNPSRFEAAMRASCGPHAPNSHDVVFEIPADCKIMIDGAIRLLSLANQLASTTRRTRLRFEEGEVGAMGYLNRVGFFECLDTRVDVEPERPLRFRSRYTPWREPHVGRDRPNQQGRAGS